MLYHCGLLDDDPFVSRSYRWMMRHGWDQPEFPADVRHEIAVWLAMPGFGSAYHCESVSLSPSNLFHALKHLPKFDELRDEVSRNWLSVTREDAIKLCRMRPQKRSGIPLIVQLRMLDDLKAKMSQTQIARTYGTNRRFVWELAQAGHPISMGKQRLPSGFELLVEPRVGRSTLEMYWDRKKGIGPGPA